MLKKTTEVNKNWKEEEKVKGGKVKEDQDAAEPLAVGTVAAAGTAALVIFVVLGVICALGGVEDVDILRASPLAIFIGLLSPLAVLVADRDVKIEKVH